MRRAPDHRNSPRNGFTLFELMLVMAVMLLIAGIVWPRMLAFYQTNRLKDHARNIHETIAAARLAAIDHGIAYQFFYEPSGRHYLMIPSEDQPASGSTDDTGSTFNLPARAGEIPLGFSLSGAGGDEKGGVTLTPQMLKDVPEDIDLSNVNWSQPVVFYPDGSGTDMLVDIVDDRQQYISISVRALTGTASLSTIKTKTQ